MTLCIGATHRTGASPYFHNRLLLVEQDIQSGNCATHNTLLVDAPQKSVLRAPWRIRPTPFWSPFAKNAVALAPRAMTFMVRAAAWSCRVCCPLLAPSHALDTGRPSTAMSASCGACLLWCRQPQAYDILTTNCSTLPLHECHLSA